MPRCTRMPRTRRAHAPCSRTMHAPRKHHAHAVLTPRTCRAHAMHMPWQEGANPLYERDNRAEKLRHFSTICSEMTSQIYLGGANPNPNPNPNP